MAVNIVKTHLILSFYNVSSLEAFANNETIEDTTLCITL